MAKDPRVDRLRTVPLFEGCDDKQLGFIASRVDEVDVPSGKTLTEKGRSGGEFFIILSGRAEVRRGSGAIATLGPGDYFGEIALLDNGPRTATVVASSALRCLVLSPGQFQDVLYQDPGIAVKMLHSVVRRLRAIAEPPAD
jgi:CRP/FNR family transcriptional regulator, cyclic AMP receptor protein